MWTARDSRAVTCKLVLDGLAASTDARQLVDCWARPGCRVALSEIETKDVIIRDGVLPSELFAGAHSNIDVRASAIGVSKFSHSTRFHFLGVPLTAWSNVMNVTSTGWVEATLSWYGRDGLAQ